MLLLSIILLWTACSKQTKVQPEVANVDELVTEQVLTKQFIVPATNIVLPVGTTLKLSADQKQISVELPKGYGFFTNGTVSAPAAGSKTLPVIVIGSYTCKCGDSESRCSVFYLSVGGFGCLHNSCSGVCSGEFVTIKGDAISGVINLMNAEIVQKVLPVTATATLNPGTKQVFFDHPQVQAAILAEHARLFKGILMPTLERIYREKKLQQDYVFVPASRAMASIDFVKELVM